MKMPPKPPPLDLGDPAQLKRAIEILPFVLSHRPRYLHWEEQRSRPVPVPDVSQEDWWRAVKFSRLGARKHIPLLAVDGSICHFVNDESVQSAVYQVDRIAGGLVNLPGPLVSVDGKNRYLAGSLEEEAIHSSQLEGATTTRLVAKRMLREGRGPRDRSEQMIVNNFRTMNHLAEWRDQPLTPELVLEIHRQVTDGTLDAKDMAGRLRRVDEPVEVGSDVGEVFHVPPPASELEARLSAMCRFANEETPGGFLHPLVRAIILHYWLAYDHPFVDGNGRTARALFYWSMLRSGHWLFEYISISTGLVRAPAQYGRAFLYTQTDENDLTYFLLHQLKIVKQALDDLQEYLRTSEQRARESAKSLESYELNHRQLALAAHALRHPEHQYVIEGHQTSHQVAYQTARTDLLEMEQKGLLRSRKSGKKFVFEGTELLLGRKVRG